MSVCDSASYRRMMLACMAIVIVVVSITLSISIANLLGVISSPVKRATESNGQLLQNLTQMLVQYQRQHNTN